MRYIVFVLFVVTLVRLVKSQTCESVRDNLDYFQCVRVLLTADPSVCSGPCSNQLSTLKTACENSGDPNSEEIISAYDTACFSGPECTAALDALNGNEDCVSAFNGEGETTTYCTGVCRNLTAAAFDTCPDNLYVSNSRSTYNQACGFDSGGTSILLQASGIATLLLVVLCALIV